MNVRAGPIVRHQLEEDRERDARADHAERHHRRRRPDPGRLCGQVGDRERRQQDRRRERDPRRHAGARGARQLELRDQPSDRVADAREQDEGPADASQRRFPARSTPRRRPTPSEPGEDAPELDALRALARIEADREEGGPERRRGDQDPRERRGDVLLAFADEDEGHGHLGGGQEHDQADAGSRDAEHSAIPGERHQERGAQRHPRPRDHRRAHVANPDLDEEEAGAPDRAYDEDEDPRAPVHRARLVRP